MQLGFVSAIFADLSLDEVLTFAAGEGFDCVEVLCWPPGGPDRKYGGVTHLDVSDFTPAMADDARALFDKHGVGPSALGYYSVPLSAAAEQAAAAVAHLYRVIDAAALLGLKTINSFIGANQHLSLEENLQRYAEVWPPIVRHAEERGVRIGIENCPMLYANTWPFGLNLARTPAIWRRMFEIIPSPALGLNYDPSHLRMQLIDPIAPIREFGSRIFHTHAKDMRIDPHCLNEVGSLALPMDRATAKLPGLGDINWGAWIGALGDAGYDGPVCIEVEDEAYTESLAARERSLRISRNVLRPLIAQ
ncbi:sugar phosphate isomerase/epimerase family protein [Botrimarina hoheduenensis]|uniref:Xylose isomerase-like TIM barrel n=1 Tax=Botrimarina hoheduenensis TaxID=2528000 RepID=A0A5C5WE12_9BACT|nr:sugar phosphate isomerase/epimerase [Botrimarina hoheduenensis]TWT48707.1 Xylose isomerase-like TIM barrel [Botrimarina hoheduenensis]